MVSNKTWKQSNLDARCGHLLAGPSAPDRTTGGSRGDFSLIVAAGEEGGELVQPHQIAPISVGVAEHERSSPTASLIRARGLAASLGQVGFLDGSSDHLSSSPGMENRRELNVDLKAKT